MSDNDQKQLDEFKASGEESSVAEPVTPAGGNAKARKGDKAQGEKTGDKLTGETGGDLIDTVTTSKAPARKADKGMKESVEEMFAGTDLSEEFKDKATTIFEAAVNAKLTAEVARLEEEFNTKLEEQVDTVVGDLTEKVDSYLSYVVEQWMEDNKLAVERGIRAEIAESFISGLRDLFVEHNVDVPEEDLNIVADMSEELEKREEALATAITENRELNARIVELETTAVFESFAKGLTDTQAEKLKALTEGVSYNDAADFQRKVAVIKEQYFGGKAILSESKDGIDPIDLAEENASRVDPSIAGYAAAISRTIRK